MRRHFGSHLVFQAACASVIFASMKQSLARLMVKIYINSLFCLILQICFDSVKLRFLSNEDKIVRGVDIYMKL